MSISYLMNTYNPLPISFSHGEGIYLYDTEGNEYLDALSGIGTCSLGHNYPAVTQTICEQASKLLHCSNVYTIPVQQKLAEKICRIANMDNVFFCNSGAEANEAALKLARKHANNKKLIDPKIIVFNSSFHGRTIATLSASCNEKIHAGFQPVLDDFIRLPINNLDQLKHAFLHNEISAVMLEPIQGEGGVQLLNKAFIKNIEKLCIEHSALLILDEIQTGNGRTGSYFAYQQLDIKPDVVTTAKGLGNGFPIGACLAQGHAASLFIPGNHGSTFGGNPLACATALTVITSIENNNLMQNAEKTGTYLLSAFNDILTTSPHVKSIRGQGLMIGIELTIPCSELVSTAMKAGLLINVTSGNVIRLLPPLIMNTTQAQRVVDTLCPLIKSFLQNNTHD
jgi:acetylornithine/N-succinyldiaminopimelate aminotransferase